MSLSKFSLLILLTIKAITSLAVGILYSLPSFYRLLISQKQISITIFSLNLSLAIWNAYTSGLCVLSIACNWVTILGSTSLGPPL